MAIDRTRILRAEHFASASNLSSQEVMGLGSVIRNMLYRSASEAITAANPAAFTDNGGQAVGMVFTTAFPSGLCTSTGHSFVTGDGPVQLLGTDLPDGMVVTTDYYVERVSTDTFYLFASRSEALDGLVADRVTVTDAGTGTHTVLCLHLVYRIPSDDGTSSTDSCTKASVDISVTTLWDAFAIVTQYTNNFSTVLGVGTIDTGPGTASTPGTLDPIDVNVVTNTSDITGTTHHSMLVIMAEIDSAIRTLANLISIVRQSIGLSEIVTPTNMLYKGTENVVGINGGLTGSVAVTTTSTTIAVSATEADVEIWLIDVAENIQVLANLIEEVDTQASTPPAMLFCSG